MNFYKITNADEIHNGLHYKTGLNEDILPFNPSGDCDPGGIYFAREDILAFLSYGPWIRRVTLPKGEDVYENPGTPKKWKAHRVILGRRRKITAKVVEELIKEGADPRADNSLALRYASRNGHTEIVKILLKAGADPRAWDSWALRWASRNGHTEIVKILLKAGADPRAKDSQALRWAAGNGHTKIVKILKKAIANKEKKNG